MRHADHAIDPLFLRRWSARAMSGEPLTQEQLFQCLEAARWAPSSRNLQHWRFAWGLHGTPAFDRLFALLRPSNQAWCARAGALVLVACVAHDADGKPWRTAEFDAGSATMSLLLQATLMGLVAHPMGGFHDDRAVTELRMPPDLRPLVMVALGLHGPTQLLPPEQQDKERPSGRHPLAALAVEGGW
ncbi:MAG: nitroreductase family protein [Gemmatimonadales bacterium]|nr:nitroreductase family protein [Gemmatimonadales bacterium]